MKNIPIATELPHPWNPEDIALLDLAPHFIDMAAVALHVVRRLPPPVYMVSGPMTTGGLGNLEANLAAYAAALVRLQSRGVLIFNQLPVEKAFIRLEAEWRDQGNGGYCWPILHKFYEPLFRSGCIRGIYFMPMWWTSKGCQRERHLAETIPLEICEIPSVSLV